MNLWKYVAPIIACVIVYLLVGILLSYVGLTIYHDIPSRNFSITGSKKFNLIIQNNAIFLPPGFKPTIFGNVYVNDSNVECSMMVVTGEVKCGEVYVDLGSIEQGKSNYFPFEIKPSKKNFTLQLEGAVNILNLLHLRRVRIINCEYLGENLYLGESVYKCLVGS